MTKIASSASVYLGVLGPFLGAVLSFIPSESAELTFMKNMMKKIDNRFDKLDYRFYDVERLINWNLVRVNFGQIEQRILAMMEEYEFLYKVPSNAIVNRKIIFLSNYESDYQNSGTKLYQAVMYAQGTFQEKLGNSVMRYTKNDRKQTQRFLLGVMYLLFQAAKIELASLQVRSYHANAAFLQREWETRIQSVRIEFERVDRAVRDKYHDQSLYDLLEYAASHTELSNELFSDGLYSLLTGKYYWRDWIVLIYNPIWGWSEHTVSTCEGHIKFRQNGRNIVIGSVDKDTDEMDLAKAEREMNNVDVYTPFYYAAYWVAGYAERSRQARDVYDSLDISDACVVTVIRCNAGLGYRCSTTRCKYVDRCPFFRLVTWG